MSVEYVYLNDDVKKNYKTHFRIIKLRNGGIVYFEEFWQPYHTVFS